LPSAEGVPALNDDCAFADVQDAEAIVKSAEQGIIGGAGVILPLPFFPEAGVTLDLRFARGLSRLADGRDALDARNQVLSFALGMEFGL
jgi:hypothetical protein